MYPVAAAVAAAVLPVAMAVVVAAVMIVKIEIFLISSYPSMRDI